MAEKVEVKRKRVNRNSGGFTSSKLKNQKMRRTRAKNLRKNKNMGKGS